MIAAILSFFIFLHSTVAPNEKCVPVEVDCMWTVEPDSSTERVIPSDLALLANHTPKNRYPSKKKPEFLLIGKNNWIRYNPISLLFGSMLFVYQSVISSQISADCPYEISCSNFSKQAIRKFGLLKGVPISADRLTRCSKIAIKDLHPLRINEDGMIVDSTSYYSIQQVR